MPGIAKRLHARGCNGKIHPLDRKGERRVLRQRLTAYRDEIGAGYRLRHDDCLVQRIADHAGNIGIAGRWNTVERDVKRGRTNGACTIQSYAKRVARRHVQAIVKQGAALRQVRSRRCAVSEGRHSRGEWRFSGQNIVRFICLIQCPGEVSRNNDIIGSRRDALQRRSHLRGIGRACIKCSALRDCRKLGVA